MDSRRWTPGTLRSMGLQRVRHDLATEQQQHPKQGCRYLRRKRKFRAPVPGGKEPRGGRGRDWRVVTSLQSWLPRLTLRFLLGPRGAGRACRAASTRQHGGAFPKSSPSHSPGGRKSQAGPGPSFLWRRLSAPGEPPEPGLSLLRRPETTWPSHGPVMQSAGPHGGPRPVEAPGPSLQVAWRSFRGYRGWCEGGGHRRKGVQDPL